MDEPPGSGLRSTAMREVAPSAPLFLASNDQIELPLADRKQ